MPTLSNVKTTYPTPHSRLYAGPTDLTALLALWPVCRPAAWQANFPAPFDLAELPAAARIAGLRVSDGVQAELVTCAEPRT